MKFNIYPLPICNCGATNSMYCLSMARVGWDKRPWQSNAYDDVNDDLGEKEAIEREITRRGVTDYYWPPSVTYRYVHDHCHCQCWVATL